MDYTKEQLQEAKRQIDSTIHKLRETLKSLETKEKSPKAQITLARRRIEAFTIAVELIERELSNECRGDFWSPGGTK